MLPAVDTPVIAKGNCGIPEYVDGGIHYHGTPELMAEYACLARDAGISIIGGCCGTTPDHVAAMAAALRATPPRPFDSDAALVALGTPWKEVPTAGAARPEGGSGRRGRGGRRRGRD